MQEMLIKLDLMKKTQIRLFNGMKDFIPVNEPLIGNIEKELVLECLETGWISSEGPFVKEFEEKFSKRVNRNFGIACSSGTAALDIALASLNLQPGDEVILPTFTIISCASAVIKTGATPVLVDCDPLTFNATPSQVLNAVTKKTKAIMVVHIYGLPMDMDKVIEFAKSEGIFIIEDAAELIGAEYKNKPCGSFGDVSTFSFYSNKHVTTGEGGMILTNNEEIAEKCRSFRNLCFRPEERFVHDELGWNYRMTNLQAALGIGQLITLDEKIKKKRWIGETYNALINEKLPLQKPIEFLDYATNIYWVYSIVLKDKAISLKEIIFELKKEGIGTRPFFYPMHKQPVFIKNGLFNNLSFPNSENLYERGFYLPSGLTLNYEKIYRISETLNRIMK